MSLLPGNMFIIFLDFDGVLHSFSSDALPTFKEAIYLEHILFEYPNAHIVIHSSWRMTSEYSEEDLWDLLKFPESLRPRFLGVSPISHPSRWESIKEYLKQTDYKGAYVILDDMWNSFGSCAHKNLICPSYETGMQDKDWKALRMRLDKCNI
jgi:hypothetical protein